MFSLVSTRTKRPSTEKSKTSASSSHSSSTINTEKEHSKIFDDVVMLILMNVLGKPRSELFQRKVIEFGGIVELFAQKEQATTSILDGKTHVLCDPSLSYRRVQTLLFTGANSAVKDDVILPDIHCHVVTSKWLISCLEQNQLVDCNPFLVKPVATVMEQEVISAEKSAADDGGVKSQAVITEPVHKKAKSYESTVAANDSLEDIEAFTFPEEPLPSTSTLKKDSFICMKSSSVPQQEKCANQAIIDAFKEMANAYKSTKDKWRAFGYEKAIFALKSAKGAIDTYEKAIALPNVGKRLAEKIWEIAESGTLSKLEMFQNDESVKSRQLFVRIWGVGPETAHQWAEQGLRTLEDVEKKAKLSANQKIGLRHFYDFDERMNRDEVAEIEAVVKQAALSLNSGLWVVTCGSYRRGKSTCGDVDVLITHPDGTSHKGIFKKILEKLHNEGFLTDDLTVQPNMTGGMAKYLGVCKLNKPGSKYRRLDIIVTPHSQYGCALLYFTGSAHFNRSMRAMADKMNLSLTEHALYKDVIRRDKVIIDHGVKVPTPTEESVFAYLGIPYRLPEERDHS